LTLGYLAKVGELAPEVRKTNSRTHAASNDEDVSGAAISRIFPPYGDADTSPGVPPSPHKAAASQPSVSIPPGFLDHAKPWPSFRSRRRICEIPLECPLQSPSQIKSFNWEMPISVPLASITPRLPVKWPGRTIPVQQGATWDRLPGRRTSSFPGAILIST
jgi:hypothetical protein